MDAPQRERRGATLTIPHEVLEHRAVLTLPDGTPFSHVVETYTSEVFAFPESLPAGRSAARRRGDEPIFITADGELSQWCGSLSPDSVAHKSPGRVSHSTGACLVQQ